EIAVGAVGGNERGDADDAGVGEEFSDLADAADVFLAVPGREAEIGIQAVADVVAVEDVGVLAGVEEFAFEFGGDGGLARAGKAGEPDHAAGVVIAQGALAGVDLAVAPVDVAALVQAVGGAAGIIVLGHDAAAGDFETIDDDEAAGGDDLGMGVEGDRAFGLERQFRDLVAADELLVAIPRDGFERGGVDDLLDGGDFT